MRRALEFPTGSVAHLADEQDVGEVADLVALERAGLAVGVLALPPAIEDSFYRYNNLPRRLAQLYRDVDPADPDEDILEEVEAEALTLVDQAYLLDEVIDAIYQALGRMPSRLWLRRPGQPEGLAVSNGRPVLLALKRVFRQDWSAGSVAARLAETASVAVAARPVLVHERLEPAASPAPRAGPAAERASRLLGRPVTVEVDAAGRLLRVGDSR